MRASFGTGASNNAFGVSAPVANRGCPLVACYGAIGPSMNMDVIAEGVEKNKELAFLKQLGCHHYQGFYSARPMLPEDMEAGDWFP